VAAIFPMMSQTLIAMARLQSVRRTEAEIVVRAEVEIVAGGRVVVRAVVDVGGLVEAVDVEAAVAGMVATAVVVVEDTSR
jgi:hypothetical protein